MVVVLVTTKVRHPGSKNLSIWARRLGIRTTVNIPCFTTVFAHAPIAVGAHAITYPGADAATN